MGQSRARDGGPMKNGAMPNLTRRRPRSYLEWRTLREWGNLPRRESVVPGFLLRIAREEAGLTQTGLAERLGISQQAVAQAERWGSNPTIAFINRWSKECNCKLVVELAAP